MYEEAARIEEQTGPLVEYAGTRICLAEIDVVRGRSPAARQRLVECAEEALQGDDLVIAVSLVRVVGMLAISEGAAPEGVRLMTAAQAHEQASGISFFAASDNERAEELLAMARVDLGDDRFEHARRDAPASVEDAAALARRVLRVPLHVEGVQGEARP